MTTHCICGGTDHKTNRSKKCTLYKKSNEKYIPKPSDIDYIIDLSKGRDKNDSMNIKRENVFLLLWDIPKTILNDENYGKKWKEMHQKALNAIQSIFTDKSCFYIEKVAGRKHYDFNLYFTKETFENKKNPIMLEYKHNTKTIFTLPQILQINAFYEDENFRNIFDTSYTHYFYDQLNYKTRLQDFINLILEDKKEDPMFQKLKVLNKTPIQIPNWNEYSKMVYCYTKDENSNYPPFIEQLKEIKEVMSIEWNEFVDKTIQDFIEKAPFNLVNFKKTIMETQQNKYFMMWDCKQKNYCLQTIDLNETDEYKVDTIGKNFVDVSTHKYKFHILLRWKNGKGIILPAYQISIKNGTTD